MVPQSISEGSVGTLGDSPAGVGEGSVRGGGSWPRHTIYADQCSQRHQYLSASVATYCCGVGAAALRGGRECQSGGPDEGGVLGDQGTHSMPINGISGNTENFEQHKCPRWSMEQTTPVTCVARATPGAVGSSAAGHIPLRDLPRDLLVTVGGVSAAHPEGGA